MSLRRGNLLEETEGHEHLQQKWLRDMGGWRRGHNLETEAKCAQIVQTSLKECLGGITQVAVTHGLPSRKVDSASETPFSTPQIPWLQAAALQRHTTPMWPLLGPRSSATSEMTQLGGRKARLAPSATCPTCATHTHTGHFDERTTQGDRVSLELHHAHHVP